LHIITPISLRNSAKSYQYYTSGTIIIDRKNLRLPKPLVIAKIRLILGGINISTWTKDELSEISNKISEVLDIPMEVEDYSGETVPTLDDLDDTNVFMAS
jgi:hypothetical protein